MMFALEDPLLNGNPARVGATIDPGLLSGTVFTPWRAQSPVPEDTICLDWAVRSASVGLSYYLANHVNLRMP